MRLGFEKFKDGMVCMIKKKLKGMTEITLKFFSSFLDNSLADNAMKVADVLSNAIPGLNFIIIIVRIMLTFNPLFKSAKDN